MSEKKSFVMYKDWAKLVRKLSDQDAGQLFKALFDYVCDGLIPELDPAADMAFTFMQQAFDRDLEKYKATCERRAEAGRMGGLAKASKSKQKQAKASKSKQSVANLADNENVNDNENENENDIYIKEKTTTKSKRFVPPTLDQVQEYCNERMNGVDADKFIDYYTANGWKVGKNAMKDWKAAVRTWERNSVKVIPQQTQAKDRNSWIDDVEL